MADYKSELPPGKTFAIFQKIIDEAVNDNCSPCQSETLNGLRYMQWFDLEAQGKFSKIRLSIKVSDMRIEVINGPEILDNCMIGDKKKLWEKELE